MSALVAHELSGREGRPQLRIIQDPISKLNLEMLYRQIQCLVEEADWSAKGEEIQLEPAEER